MCGPVSKKVIQHYNDIERNRNYNHILSFCKQDFVIAALPPTLVEPCQHLAKERGSHHGGWIGYAGTCLFDLLFQRLVLMWGKKIDI